ncbi:MAG: 6-pyruvoyl-tetrahydropterin synthase-related protein, partial [Pseudohongiellaceae bacterium]
MSRKKNRRQRQAPSKVAATPDREAAVLSGMPRWLPEAGLLAVVVGLTLLAAYPLMTGQLIVTHELVSPLVRMDGIIKYIGDGQLFVRWIPDMSRGYGYPEFNFYSPLFYYTAALLSVFGFGIISLFNLSNILYWVLSGIGMYLFSRKYFGKYGALVSAVAYVYAPYHILDIYVRGAAAEFIAFAVLPYVLWSFNKVVETAELRFVAIASLSIAALNFSHNITMMLFIPLTLVYILFVYYTSNTRNKNILLMIVGSFALGMALTAFFWMPALLEKDFSSTAAYITGYYHYSNHFVHFAQFFDPGWSFAGSLPGRASDGQEMSYQIGLVHIALFLAAMAVIPRIYRKARNTGLVMAFFVFTTLAAMFFSTGASEPFWNNLPLLQFAQFPWRFLIIVVLSVSFLAGAISLVLKSETQKIIFAVVAIIALLVFSLPLSKPRGYFANIPDTPLVAPEISRDLSVSQFHGRYRHMWTPMWARTNPESDPVARLSVLQGQVEATENRINSITYEYVLQVDEEAQFKFNQYYFPGWKLFINGEEVQIQVGEDGLPV